MRTSLVIGAFVIAFLTVAILMFFGFGILRVPFTRDLARGSLRETSQQVSTQLDALVNRVQSMASVAHDLGTAGMIGVDDSEKLKVLTGAFLRHGPDVTSVVVADQSGKEILYAHLPGTKERWMMRKSDPTRRPGRAEILFWDAAGKPLSGDVYLGEYDARTRPWFELAARVDPSYSVRWSKPFVFRSTGEPGISAVTAFYYGGKRFHFAADLRLIELSRFSGAVKPSEHGYAFILDENGLILGLPQEDRPFEDSEISQHVLKAVETLQISSLTEGYRVWKEGGKTDGAIFKFGPRGREWFGTLRKKSVGDHVWWVGTFAPASDFSPSFTHQFPLFILVIFLSLTISSAVAKVLADWFARPLEQLLKSSTSIGRMELHQPVPVNSKLLEIQKLSNAQEQMRNNLLRATTELHEANDRLEQKILDRTKALRKSERESRQAVHQLEEASRNRIEFLARISHEIRNPLNVITGLSHLGRKSGDAKQQLGYLEKISEAGTRISAIVEDLLDVSRLEIGQLRVRSVSFKLNETLEQVEKVVSYRAEEKDLPLKIARVPEEINALVGDGQRLGQVLSSITTHLIQSALQGSVSLRVNAVNREEKTGNCTLRFVVEVVSRVRGEVTFEARQREAALSVTQQMIEFMGGTVESQSPSDRANRFSFQVPFLLARVDDFLAKEPAPDVMLTGFRVLVVDDQETNRMIAHEMLRALGCEVETANEGQEAVNILQQRPRDFDIVFMDIQMPVMDGREASTKIRDVLKLEHLVIVAMTAYAAPEDQARFMAAGMNEVLTKPLQPSVLAELMLRKYRQISLLKGLAKADGDGISFSKAFLNLNFDGELLGKAIENFDGRFARAVQQIRDAISKPDWDHARFLVHALAGASGTIGAESLRAEASRLETAIVKRQDRVRIDELLQEVERCLSQLLGSADTGPLANAKRALSP